LPHNASRRRFLQLSAAFAAGAWAQSCTSTHRKFEPGEKLNLGVIGVGNRGAEDLEAAAGENIVALCDVDRGFLLSASKLHPDAHLYADFRDMLLCEKLDAVVVATPDHNHAVVAMAAMQHGKHVYVQKPLTRTISEARALTEAARKYKVVSQMGNQGHSGEGLRLMQEWVAAGAIGPIREVHCWTNRPIWPQGYPRPTDTPPVPEGLDWDLWIGPSPMRPYNPAYHPFSWRAWQDFGAGAMGDMACHVMDAACTILKLGTPSSIIATEAFNVIQVPGATGWQASKRVDYSDSYPPASVIHVSFPARGEMPPVKLHWYDGGILPERPDELEPERKLPESGTIFVGDKGKMMCETYSEGPRLIPETAMAAFTRPPKTLPRVPDGAQGHEKNWLDAIRTHGQATSNFDYAGPFTEVVLLGNVALRFPGQRLMWDGASAQVTNVAEANQFVQHHYREGWSLT